MEHGAVDAASEGPALTAAKVDTDHDLRDAHGEPLDVALTIDAKLWRGAGVASQPERIVLALTDAVATRERAAGRLVIDPKFIQALAAVWRAMPGSRVVGVRDLRGVRHGV